MLRSEEHNKKIGESLRGQKKNYSTVTVKGRKYMNNGIVEKFIKPEDIQSYLDNGWELGRLKR